MTKKYKLLETKTLVENNDREIIEAAKQYFERNFPDRTYRIEEEESHE